ncbi:MAG: glycosyltransferase family 2 protein [Actinobacteria bacterium]|nr:glycosyltransferase family 2 protein [Actinomycetota bacterium]
MTSVGSAATVSVILPLHNGAPYVEDTVESIAAQTRPPLELVVVDDGSSDGGADLMKELDVDFPVRLVRREQASGQSLARNVGVDNAAGDLLAFCDQDDLWHPLHLAELCAALEEDPSAGWAYSDFDEIDSAGRVVTMSFMEEHGVQHPKRTLGACIASDLMVLPSASVLRRTAFDEVGGFDENLSGYEDDDLYVRMFRSGWRLAFVARSLTRFRVHASSSSASISFARSRMVFSQKLRIAIEDDRRSNRYWFRDPVAPRFFTTSVHDYVRAIEDQDWEAAEIAFEAIEHFASERHDAFLRLKLLPLRNPRLFRRLLLVNQALPRSLRLTDNPTLRLR